MGDVPRRLGKCDIPLSESRGLPLQIGTSNWWLFFPTVQENLLFLFYKLIECRTILTAISVVLNVWTRSISITWELVRNADFSAAPKTYCILVSPQGILLHVQDWRLLFYAFYSAFYDNINIFKFMSTFIFSKLYLQSVLSNKWLIMPHVIFVCHEL